MLPKTYEPNLIEEKWLKIWQEERFFTPKTDESVKPFTIVIPPPNITGALHMGHALNNTLQDIIIRHQKMSGKSAFWVPGTDHGGIATQNVMEKSLRSQGKTKDDLGREEFFKKMWEWYEECGGTILGQLKKLGCAIDFSKENIRFTMDEKRAVSVMESFKELWDNKLIYRGERMINWCPRCYTALSDIEVEFSQEKSHLWHIKYPYSDSSGYITVATTRPETMLGDMAVAVNPKDERYKSFIGKTLNLPLTDRKIPIIADDEVDQTFGTGVVKVTPSHDNADFEIAQRHNLKHLQVISDTGKMINCPEKYLGKKAIIARKEITEDLKSIDALEKEEPYKHNVGKCYRCDNHIEPLISEQWFVKTSILAEPAIKKVEEGEFSLYPKSWEKPFTLWLKNIKDWCISRQIWWGHRIPAYYCKECSKDGLFYDEKNILKKVSVAKGAKPIVAKDKPAECPDCKNKEIEQDPDVLDTWFSSALWPFSVFGWPQKTKELSYFYPTSLLVTGYEILYLWVARMLMSGLFHMKQMPFSKVYVHGIVRDKNGQKMSKSKGNVIDPLDMMKKYGTDAMRFSLIIQAVGGKDIPFNENSIIGGRNFVNKIYNISRFIQMYADKDKKYAFSEKNLDTADKWILQRFNLACEKYSSYMDKYLLPEALDAVYGFLWDEFCDWYIEFSKPALNCEEKDRKLAVAINIFGDSLKLLYPFMPFITEELYSSLASHLKEAKRSLYMEKLPAYKNLEDKILEKKMSETMGIIKSIRSIRAQFSINPAAKINAAVFSKENNIAMISDMLEHIKTLSSVESLEIIKTNAKPKNTVGLVSGEFNVYVHIDGNLEIDKEKARLQKEKEELAVFLDKWTAKSNDESFIKNAPTEEVEKLKLRIKETKDKLERLNSFIRDLDETIAN